MIKLRNLALTVASIVFLIPFLTVMAIYKVNSDSAAAATEATDGTLNEIMGSWIAGGIPPEERIITFIVTDRLPGGLLEHSLGSGVGTALFALIRRPFGKQERDMTLIAGGRPALNWQAEILLWARDKDRRLAALSRQLARAHEAGARIRIVSRGEGTLLALEAVSGVSGSAEIERFIALGDSRETLRGKAVRPRNIKEFACVWLSGQGPTLDLLDEDGRWTRLPVKSLMGSLSEGDIIRAVASLAQEGGTLASSLKRAGIIKPSLTGRWRGFYRYPTEVDGKPVKPKPPVEFFAQILQEGSAFKGTITEPNTFGDETSPFLRADILAGAVDPRGRIRFIKKYDGTGGQSHSVVYQGTLSPAALTLTGTWTAESGFSGTFSMDQEPAPAK